MNLRHGTIALFAALGFLLGWTAPPATCSAQSYGCQVQPVQAYNYPNYQGYNWPAPGPGLLRRLPGAAALQTQTQA